MKRDTPIKWIKAYTQAVHDPKIYRLTFAERGVWWSALLFSAHASDIPGQFIINDEPMTIADIQQGLHCRTKDDDRAVAQAFAAFVGGELMNFTPGDGWGILNWDKWQTGYAAATREEERDRKSRYRAKLRAARATGTNGPIPLRPDQ